MDYSMDQYISVWHQIKTAVGYSQQRTKLLALIADEVFEDLLRVREYSLVDCSQQQFWVEYQFWFSNKWFPGATSLLKEITNLRLARCRVIIGRSEDQSKEEVDGGTSKHSGDHTNHQTPSAAASRPSLQSPDNTRDVAMEGTQPPPKTSSHQKPTVSNNEEEGAPAIRFLEETELISQYPDHFLPFSPVLQTSKMDRASDRPLPLQDINEALKKFEVMNQMNNRGWRKYSVHLMKRMMSLPLSLWSTWIRSRGRFEKWRTENYREWCFIVHVRPTDFMEVLENEAVLKSKLDNALKKYGEDLGLPTLMEAYKEHAKQSTRTAQMVPDFENKRKRSQAKSTFTMEELANSPAATMSLWAHQTVPPRKSFWKFYAGNLGPRPIQVGQPAGAGEDPGSTRNGKRTLFPEPSNRLH
ncbi:hypothetical protein BDZ45DRAFT_753211 [Acephala macrosclerotiorum]|nr:hypothetical protein BDZ45DRAFT_753211 [Acephala macrosclerotiorum]